MIIKLSPNVGTPELVVKKHGDALTINGERFDFRSLPEGAVLPASAIECEFIDSDVSRINGDLVVTLRFPVTNDSSEAARFPADIVDPPDGIMRLPQ